jgi:SPOR domain
MSDDYTHRPYRSNDIDRRGAPSNAPGSNPGSDPLAELARLIGQNDPFGEYGREGAHRAAAPAEWDDQPPAPGYAPQTAPDAAQNFDAGRYHGGANESAAYQTEAADFGPPPAPRQTYGTGQDSYQPEHEAHDYSGEQVPGYETGPYYANQVPPSDEDLYDDVPPSRRRMGILAVAAVFALVVIGTAGAFGYRALFGSSGSSGPTPVIKADATPSKIVPAAKSKDPQNSKLIYDRVNGRGQDEKIVSREEQPIEMKDKPAGFPQAIGAQQQVIGSGIVGTEPKKVHTIAIRPEQPVTGDARPSAVPAAPARVANVAPPNQPTPVPVTRSIGNASAAADPPPVARPKPPAHRAPAAAANAPLSLSPNAQPPARAPSRATRTASVPPAARAAPAARSTGGYAVQVSSQRSEADAQAAFRSLQAKYPSQLGGKQPIIHRVDLGAKGIYFRAMVGPFADAHAASALCSSLKAAGGSCLIQRN